MSASSVDGRRLRAFGACTSRGRVVPQLALAHQEAAEPAHGRKPALDAARREPAPVLARRELAHVLRIELRPGVDALLAAVVDQRREVARVAARRVRRQLALVAQAREEALDAASRAPAVMQPRASIASLTISPMRTRKSVLIVGR